MPVSCNHDRYRRNDIQGTRICPLWTYPSLRGLGWSERTRISRPLPPVAVVAGRVRVDATFWCTASSSHVTGYPIDVPATTTLPDANPRYQEALDRHKWTVTNRGCSFLLLSAQFWSSCHDAGPSTNIGSSVTDDATPKRWAISLPVPAWDCKWCQRAPALCQTLWIWHYDRAQAVPQWLRLGRRTGTRTSWLRCTRPVRWCGLRIKYGPVAQINFTNLKFTALADQV